MIWEIKKFFKSNWNLFFSLAALIISACTYFKTIESGVLANNANSLANKANTIAATSMEEAKKFNIITAETGWSNLLDDYNEIDDSLYRWENEKEISREGAPVESKEELLALLNKINVPLDIQRLYLKRYEKYQSLKNIATQYQPLKDRLPNINLVLPAAPVLPRAGIILRGVSMSGGVSIN